MIDPAGFWSSLIALAVAFVAKTLGDRFDDDRATVCYLAFVFFASLGLVIGLRGLMGY